MKIKIREKDEFLETKDRLSIVNDKKESLLYIQGKNKNTFVISTGTSGLEGITIKPISENRIEITLVPFFEER